MRRDHTVKNPVRYNVTFVVKSEDGRQARETITITVTWDVTLARLSENWLETTGKKARIVDLNNDSIVNLFDYAIWAGQWAIEGDP